MSKFRRKERILSMKNLEIRGSDSLLTKEQLRAKLNLASTRMVDQLVKKRKIPSLKLGYRTIRFDWGKVQAALEKLEIKEVGRK